MQINRSSTSGKEASQKDPQKGSLDQVDPYKKLQHDHDVLRRILDLLGHVTEKETVDDICRTIVEGVRDELKFDRAGLHLWHADEGVFRGTFGTDEQGRTKDEHDLWWRGEGWPPWEEIKKGNVFVEDQLDQPPPKPGEEGIKAHLVVLRFGERIYGILSVDNRISRKPITKHELKYLTLFSHIVGNAVDISRAKEALAQSEERFRQVADNSREWIWETDTEGRYTYSSPVVKNILGYAPEEVIGQSLFKFIPESTRKNIQNAFDTAVQGKQPIQRLINVQRHKNGGNVIFETSGLFITDINGNLVGYRGVHRDITSQTRMEEQLRQARKMEAVGRLAGGIAHYFNNLLTMIMGCSAMAMDQLDEASGIRDDIEQIQEAGKQAAELTRQLLALSQRQVLNIHPFIINQSLNDIRNFLQHTLGKGIDLVMQLDPDAGHVNADEDRLKYVILHLVINARAAMMETAEKVKLSPIGGGNMEWTVTAPGEQRQLIIQTKPTIVQIDECKTRPHMKPGKYVILSICDTGVGMPEEVREHLFEPFFTTKEVGEGIGLSLSTIYGTMTQMGGDIRVESELGKGTTFALYLPIHNPTD